ncbi:hypothetical protein FXF53_25110 [Micromonospora sp. WP24]|uniref:hypothetical protein n=1 Tax=Micromonospora sp. WP24 TaxID=2604469 RepID=UPI0011D93A18|nr:hypothetical protein [Micromonospora sp. WP24]TYB95257.1 hypothetical protein FXF53_25110 [Micromonospora sp. WP24]
MTIADPRLLRPPTVLRRSAGLALLHWGVINGPHGLSLVVEVVDEDATGALQKGPWKDPQTDNLSIYAAVDSSAPIYPKTMARFTGPSWQRWMITFDRYDRPARVDPATAKITIIVRPIDTETVIDLA